MGAGILCDENEIDDEEATRPLVPLAPRLHDRADPGELIRRA